MKLGSGILWLPVVVTILMTGAMAIGLNMLVRDALREHARILHYELLAEGGDAIQRAADLSFERFERRITSQMVRHPEHLAELLRNADEGRGDVVLYDLRGNLLSGAWSLPEIASLLTPDQIDRRRAIARLHGDTAFTEDNHARHQLGLDAVPVRAHYRIYPEAGAVVGFGQVQRNAAARLAHAEAQMLQYLRWYGLIGGAIGLGGVLLAGCLSAWATRRWIVVPLRRIEQVLAGRLPGGVGLDGRAARVGEGMAGLQEDLATARAAAETAARARLAAEEERDRLRADFDRELRAAKAVAAAAARDALTADRAALLGRAQACLGGKHADAFSRWRLLAAMADGPREPLDIAAWVQAVVDALPERHRARVRPNIAIEGVLHASAPNLEEALRDLIANACEAAGPTDGPVSLDVAAVDGQVEFRVVDQGSGIPEDIRGLVVEPLFSTRPDAAGLGLARVREVARLHDGSFEIRTEPGKGTAVVLRIPMSA